MTGSLCILILQKSCWTKDVNGAQRTAAGGHYVPDWGSSATAAVRWPVIYTFVSLSLSLYRYFYLLLGKNVGVNLSPSSSSSFCSHFLFFSIRVASSSSSPLFSTVSMPFDWEAAEEGAIIDLVAPSFVVTRSSSFLSLMSLVLYNFLARPYFYKPMMYPLKKGKKSLGRVQEELKTPCWGAHKNPSSASSRRRSTIQMDGLESHKLENGGTFKPTRKVV